MRIKISNKTFALVGAGVLLGTVGFRTAAKQAAANLGTWIQLPSFGIPSADTIYGISGAGLPHGGVLGSVIYAAPNSTSDNYRETTITGLNSAHWHTLTLPQGVNAGNSVISPLGTGYGVVTDYTHRGWRWNNGTWSHMALPPHVNVTKLTSLNRGSILMVGGQSVWIDQTNTFREIWANGTGKLSVPNGILQKITQPHSPTNPLVQSSHIHDKLITAFVLPNDKIVGEFSLSTGDPPSSQWVYQWSGRQWVPYPMGPVLHRTFLGREGGAEAGLIPYGTQMLAYLPTFTGTTTNEEALLESTPSGWHLLSKAPLPGLMSSHGQAYPWNFIAVGVTHPVLYALGTDAKQHTALWQWRGGASWAFVPLPKAVRLAIRFITNSNVLTPYGNSGLLFDGGNRLWIYSGS